MMGFSSFRSSFSLSVIEAFLFANLFTVFFRQDNPLVIEETMRDTNVPKVEIGTTTPIARLEEIIGDQIYW